MGGSGAAGAEDRGACSGEAGGMDGSRGVVRWLFGHR